MSRQKVPSHLPFCDFSPDVPLDVPLDLPSHIPLPLFSLFTFFLFDLPLDVALRADAVSCARAAPE